MSTFRELERKKAALEREVAIERATLAELREAKLYCNDKGAYNDAIRSHQQVLKDLAEELSILMG